MIFRDGSVIGKPEDFMEFKWKYKDKLLELFEDEEMVDDFIHLLDENSETTIIIHTIGDLLKKLFLYMINYQYLPENQSITYIRCMVHIVGELSWWEKEASSIWDRIDDGKLIDSYEFARNKFLFRELMRPDIQVLDKVIPKLYPYKQYTLNSYTNYETIKEFCKKYINSDLPEIVDYVESMSIIY